MSSRTIDFQKGLFLVPDYEFVVKALMGFHYGKKSYARVLMNGMWRLPNNVSNALLMYQLERLGYDFTVAARQVLYPGQPRELRVAPIYSQAFVDELALSLIKQTCRARPRGYNFSKKFIGQGGTWDGYKSLMRGSHFPTGLELFVRAALGRAEVSLRPSPVWPKRFVSADCLQGVTLREYQTDAADVMLQVRRGVAKMATNSGKTEVMAAMCLALAVGSVVVVPRQDLMYQTAERFEERLKERVGRVGDGVRSFDRVTVAVINSLAAMLEKPDEATRRWMATVQAIYLDECHLGSSSRVIETLERITAPYRFGFSGTPLKYQELDDLRLMAHTGPVFYNVTNADMIEWGYSSKPYIHMVTYKPKHTGKRPKLQWQRAYSRFIVENEARNEAAARLIMGLEGVTLVVVRREKHGQLMQELLPDVPFLNFRDSASVRRFFLDEIRQRSIKTVISSTIWDLGVDLPGLDNIVLLLGGQSSIGTLQRVGRVLRENEFSGNVVHVYDFVDDQETNLWKHTRARLKTYHQEGFDIDEITMISSLL